MTQWMIIVWMLIATSVSAATSMADYWSYTAAQRAEAGGNSAKAVQIYTQLLAKDPDNLLLMQTLADALYHAGDYTKSGVIYDQLATRLPKAQWPALYYNQGNVAFRLGRYPEAVVWYRKALALNPDDLQAKHNLELAQRRMDENTPPPPPLNDRPKPPPPPSPMLNALDQLERESRRNRRPNNPEPPRQVERDW